MQTTSALRAGPAGHPFRQRLSRPPRPRSDDQDIKLFVLSFTAFFICIYTFIF